MSDSRSRYRFAELLKLLYAFRRRGRKKRNNGRRGCVLTAHHGPGSFPAVAWRFPVVLRYDTLTLMPTDSARGGCNSEATTRDKYQSARVPLFQGPSYPPGAAQARRGSATPRLRRSSTPRGSRSPPFVSRTSRNTRRRPTEQCRPDHGYEHGRA